VSARTESGAQQIPRPTTPGTITLIEGTAFCVCLPSGDIATGGTEGVFYRDTRLASRWELLVDGDPVEPMAVLPGQPFFATFVGRSRPRPGRAESTMLVTRTLYVGDGMREDIAVQNFAEESIGVHISLRAESDLAGIFDVKAGRNTGIGQHTVDAGCDDLVISSRLHDRLRGVRVSAHGAAVGEDIQNANWAYTSSGPFSIAYSLDWKWRRMWCSRRDEDQVASRTRFLRGLDGPGPVPARPRSRG
jgi:hypothetical protein